MRRANGRRPALLQGAPVEGRVVEARFELFEAQSREYQKEVLGNAKVNVGIEAAIRMGWDRFIGTDGIFVGMSSFGASGPYKALYEKFGITSDAGQSVCLQT